MVNRLLWGLKCAAGAKNMVFFVVSMGKTSIFRAKARRRRAQNLLQIFEFLEIWVPTAENPPYLREILSTRGGFRLQIPLMWKNELYTWEIQKRIEPHLALV